MGDTAYAQGDRALLDALAKLGGERVTEDDIEIGGRKLRLPSGMTPKDAVRFLRQYDEAQNAETRFSRDYRYRPQDVAVALMRALKSVFGMTGIGRPTISFFGSTPPERITVPIGPGERDTVEVPAGLVEVPALSGTLCVAGTYDDELGSLGRIVIDAPRRMGAAIEGLFVAVADQLAAASIYKGKAITAQDTPTFLDVSGTDPGQVFYAPATRAQLDANLWAMIRDTPAHRAAGLPLKRSVLLHGPYGTGKTLAATLTAQTAERHGWTFITVRPGRDSIREALTTAALYAPAIVFVEDIDVIADVSHDAEGIAEVLDLFDGMGAKAAEICLVLTTNRPENIHRGLLRPGRLDALVEIGTLDTAGVEAMLRGLVPDHVLGHLDLARIASRMDGWLPAFAREAIGRASRYAIAEGRDAHDLATEDFIRAADGMTPQLDLFHGGRDVTPPPTLDMALRRAVRSEARAAIEGATFTDWDTPGALRPADLDGPAA